MKNKYVYIRNITALTLASSLVIFVPTTGFMAAELTSSKTASSETNFAATSSSAAAASVGSTSTLFQKTENIYSKLASNGSAQNAYVVNAFSLDSACDITDYGNYSDVKNLSTLSSLNSTNGSVALSCEEGNFYYQGTIDQVQLPWLFTIEYTLDGKPIDAQDLGGKSGALAIHLGVKANPDADSIFYENYVMQISLTLDSTLCKNIIAEKGAIADAGANQQVTFTLLPETDGDFTIQSDVNDFTMSGFSIAAVPYSMSMDTEDLGTDELTSQFTELTDAVSQLNDGTGQLADGVHELSNGSLALFDGSANIQSGLSQLSNSSGSIVDGSAQINSALQAISSQLAAGSSSNSADQSQLPSQESYTLTDSEMADIQNAFASLSPTQSAALQKLLVHYGYSNGVMASIEDSMNSLTQLQSGLTQLADNYNTFHKGLVSYTDGIKQLSTGYDEFHNGLHSYLDGVDQIDSGASELADGMDEFNNGVSDMPDQVQTNIDEMMSKYTSDDFEAVSFVDSRNTNIKSVQFILSTEGIELPEESVEEVTEKKLGFWERLLALFSF